MKVTVFFVTITPILGYLSLASYLICVEKKNNLYKKVYCCLIIYNGNILE